MSLEELVSAGKRVMHCLERSNAPDRPMLMESEESKLSAVLALSVNTTSLHDLKADIPRRNISNYRRQVRKDNKGQMAHTIDNYSRDAAPVSH
jgi:hypothetical protein